MTRLVLFRLSTSLVVAILAGTLGFSESPPASADDIQVQTDVVYGIVDGVQLKLDIAIPKGGATHHPTIVVIHGGGWGQGDKRQHTGELRALAERGFVAASIGYRLVPEAIFPAQVDDVRCAVRFLRAHADQYHVDGRRMGAMGFSAGAHLAMMLGVVDPGDGFENLGGWPDQDSTVDAVVGYFGPTDLLETELSVPGRQILKAFLGVTREESPDPYRMASPITHVDPSDAPMLLFHGTRDPLVPFDQAVRMAQRLTEANVNGRVELLLGASHGWGGERLDRTRQQSVKFFEAQLVHRDR